MPELSIFISYRIADTQVEARLLYTELANRFGADAVFLDKTRLKLGMIWPEELKDKVSNATVVLLLIKESKKWMGFDERDCTFRLNDPKDWVRLEIETAKGLGKEIIPLKIDGGDFPDPVALPESLQFLLPIQGLKITTDEKWDPLLDSFFSDLEKRGFQQKTGGTTIDPLAEYPLPAGVSDLLDDHPSPYLGLAYFDPTAARLFFGRTREMLEFFSLVEDAEVRLISLLGHSGVGKSSFLAAGVLPRLEATRQPHYARRNKTATKGLATQLDHLRAQPQNPGKPPVYILDQVEEIFTDPLPGEQEAFVERLRAVVREEPEATIVIGFRSDYQLDVSDLLARVNCRQESLPLRPLNQPALVEAIEGVWRDPVLKNRYQIDLENGFANYVARNLMHTESGGAAAILQNRLLKLYEQAKVRRIPSNPYIRLTTFDYDALLDNATAEEELFDFQIQRLRAEGLPNDDKSLLETLDKFVVDKATARTLPKSKLPVASPDLYAALHRVNLLTELTESQAVRLSHDLLAPIVRRRYQQFLLNDRDIENVRLRLREVRKYLIDTQFTKALEEFKGATLRNTLPEEVWQAAFELAFVFLQAEQKEQGTYALLECANHLDFAGKLRPPFPDEQFPDGQDCPALLEYLRRCEPAFFIQMERLYFPTMIPVTGGTFDMGDVLGDNEFPDRELPVHRVTLSDYALAETPVTWQQYGLYCHAIGIEVPGDSGFGRGEWPVINVNWEEAVAYANWLSRHTNSIYRLPTEAEWEYAAREGGKSVRLGNGKNIADPAEMNFDASETYIKSYSKAGEYREKTTPVRQFDPNALGFFDMSGNVWEWCGDKYGPYSAEHQTNPTGPEDGSSRVVRGGSWAFVPRLCRVAYRNPGTLASRTNDLGFRLAL
jgi:formylglycine-generating enzyme required for sulfatase activity